MQKSCSNSFVVLVAACTVHSHRASCDMTAATEVEIPVPSWKELRPEQETSC